MDEIDLGDEHFLRYVRWAPDELESNYARYGRPLPRVERAGAIVRHRAARGWCESVVHFDLPETLLMTHGESQLPIWRVDAWEPLTLSPSLRCALCGDHGFIRGGRWVRA